MNFKVETHHIMFLINCSYSAFQDRPVYKNFPPAFLQSVFSSQKSSTDVQVLPYNLLVAIRTVSPSPAFVCVCVCVCVCVSVDFQLSTNGRTVLKDVNVYSKYV